MLILSRKPGEAIVLDGGIRIVVQTCERGSVRLGIEAPPDVGILREEVLEKVAAQNRRASETPHTGAHLLARRLPPALPASAPVPRDEDPSPA